MSVVFIAPVIALLLALDTIVRLGLNCLEMLGCMVQIGEEAEAGGEEGHVPSIGTPRRNSVLDGRGQLT